MRPFVGRFRRSAAFANRLAKDEFDLSVERAQIVLGPAREFVQQVRGHAQQVRFPLSHDNTKNRV